MGWGIEIGQYCMDIYIMGGNQINLLSAYLEINWYTDKYQNKIMSKIVEKIKYFVEFFKTYKTIMYNPGGS